MGTILRPSLWKLSKRDSEILCLKSFPNLLDHVQEAFQMAKTKKLFINLYIFFSDFKLTLQFSPKPEGSIVY